MAQLNFNANEVDPSVSFEPVPAGKYVAAITNSEMKATKEGTGSYLELVFTIIEGSHKDRNLWARLNLNNANQTAVQIARAELSAICRAVGVMQPRDSFELHNLPLLITVKTKAREDTGELTNEIKGYAKRENINQAPQQQPTGGNTAPWKRGA